MKVTIRWQRLGSRLALLALLVLGLECVVRQRIVRTPAGVVHRYLNSVEAGGGGGPSLQGMKERTRHLTRACNGSDAAAAAAVKAMSSQYYVRADRTRPGLVLCLPARMATRAAFDYVNSVYGSPCTKDRHSQPRHCALNSTVDLPPNATKVIIARHPLDRLILEFRHQKPELGGQKKGDTAGGRGLKALRPRFPHKKLGRKAPSRFREFLKSRVLGGSEAVTRPVSEVCGLCRHTYHWLVNLDAGLKEVDQMLAEVGFTRQELAAVARPKADLKTVTKKARRKFYSEVTAEEMERLYKMFERDFSLLGYGLKNYME